MGQLVDIRLGPFARSEIEAISGSDVATGVRDALAQYTDRPDWRDRVVPPRWFQASAGPEDRAVEVLTLSVGAETGTALEREARRHRMTMAEIAHHAVLVYLAERDEKAPGDPSGEAPVTTR